MTEKSDGKQDVVLLSWVSVNHQAAPLLSAIDNSRSPYRSRVRKLYLCWRDAPSPDGDRERESLRETIKTLRDTLDPQCPEIVKIPWKANASPTNHAAIRPFAEETLKRVREENPQADIVIHLSPGTPAMHAVWLVLGTTGFVADPVSLIQTADDRGRAAGEKAVQNVHLDLDTWLRRFRTAKVLKEGQDDNGRIWDPSFVRSPRLYEALKKLEEWAPLRVPVLLVGERGTGKTTLANFLRSMSPFQKDQPSGWPVVVCGQFRVNPQLARSELFGHVKGAFTGATNDRSGLLEQADGDTIFFDEIADIDRDTQRLLMAAIEGRGFQRLGETRQRQSRFRLVSATNRPLADLQGTFLDQDFFDRIAVFVLHVPPLRDCREDLTDAWKRVLSSATKTSGVKPDGWEEFLTHKTLLESLTEHPLPGNFRDLQKVAFHLLAALHARHKEKDILEEALRSLDSPKAVRSAAGLSAEELRGMLPIKGGLRCQLDDYEREWFRAALAEARGNKSEAARLLGLPRKTFDHRWEKLSEK